MNEKIDDIRRDLAVLRVDLATLRVDMATVVARLKPEPSLRERLDAIISRFPDTPRPERKHDAGTLYCSFCGKCQHDVEQLVAGPGSCICDECVELCMTIVIEKRQRDRRAKWREGLAKLYERTAVRMPMEAMASMHRAEVTSLEFEQKARNVTEEIGSLAVDTLGGKFTLDQVITAGLNALDSHPPLSAELRRIRYLLVCGILRLLEDGTSRHSPKHDG
jgi:hypothetical protein